MKLILSRHGNTFGPGDKVCWVGSRNDLPLVDEGFEQARRFAAALKKAGVMPTEIYCGTLKRSRDYAHILMEELGIERAEIEDKRLDEVDYGEWTGLSNQEIVDQFGKKAEKALDGWSKRSEWPVDAGWGGGEDVIVSATRGFVDDLLARHGEEDVVVAVSSNGVLRYFLKNVEGAFEQKVEEEAFKMATGNISQFTFKNDEWSLDCWNKNPAKDGVLK